MGQTHLRAPIAFILAAEESEDSRPMRRLMPPQWAILACNKQSTFVSRLLPDVSEC